MKFRSPYFTLLVLGVLCVALFAGCGGKSSTSTPGGNTITTSGQNVAPLTVNSGPPELAGNGGAINTAFVSIDVCVPGTNTCQTINNVAVDSGSVGVRILASKLSLKLPTETSNGSQVAECNQFADGYTWGPVETADITVTGTSEKAASIPVQVIDDTNSFTAAPGSCASSSAGSDNSVTALGAYAILGVGVFRQDCGGGCTLAAGDPNNPGFYYTCASGNCAQISVSIPQQVQNPVGLFPSDNNGTIIELPPIASTGAASVTGSLVFGIGTKSDNKLTNATMLTLDQSGTFTTLYGVAQTRYSGSIIDSGSNGIYFLDPSADGIPTCSNNASFYCPSTTLNLSATNQGLNTVSSHVTFSVANANQLSSAAFAFNDLAGTNVSSTNGDSFDFGLPFFFGRNVYTGLENVQNGLPTATGQYVAY